MGWGYWFSSLCLSKGQQHQIPKGCENNLYSYTYDGIEILKMHHAQQVLFSDSR